MEWTGCGFFSWATTENQVLLWWVGEGGRSQQCKGHGDLKRPTEMSPEEYKSLPAKNNWQRNIKWSLYSINRDAADTPMRLCHMLILTAVTCLFLQPVNSRFLAMIPLVRYWLIVRLELELSTTSWKTTFFFPAGSSPSRLSVCAHALNEETFKAFIVDILQVSNDTNLQRTYIGELRASWDWHSTNCLD